MFNKKRLMIAGVLLVTITIVSVVAALPGATAVGVSEDSSDEGTTTPPQKQSTGKGRQNISVDQIHTAIRNGFGPKTKIETVDGQSYLPGDFNGDGFSDIAVLLNIEEARADLKDHGVKFIDADPWSRRNGAQIDPITDDMFNCLGIAIIHGTAVGWAAAEPAGKFMVYNCFSSFRIIRKGQRLRRGSGSRGPTPKPKGDSIFLDLESGGTAVVYWNGKTYRGFGIRLGD
jgi:hypothetical protein